MTPLPPALRTLLRLRIKGRLRRVGRELKTVKGFLLFAVGFGMFALYMVPLMFGAFTRPGNPELFQAVFPFVLLGFTLIGFFTSSGERAIYFSPAEIAMLFSGPFTRRQLLLYRLVSTQGGLLFTSVIFAIVLGRFATSWISSFVGAFLAFQFVYLFGMAFMLLGEVIAERAYTRLRRIIIAAAVALLVGGIWRVLDAANAGDFLGLVNSVRAHHVGRIVILPLEPYGRIIAAERLFPDAIVWTTVAAAINSALVGIILLLDANYLETAIAVSQKHYSRMQRWRQGGAMPASAKSARRRIPVFPRFGGAGIVCWRQLTGLVRSARTMIMMLIPFAILGGYFFVTGDASNERESVWAVAGMMLMWLTVMMSGAIRFDFRSDLDQIEYLKTLPVRPIALAAGQVAVPVLITLLFQAVILGAAAWQAGPLWVLPVALLAALPVNLFISGVENLVFLLMPTRVMGRGPGDFQFMGRQMILLLVKFLVIAVAGGSAAAVGGLLYLILGPQWIPIGVAAWCVVTAEALALLPAVGWAFNRFDPATDTPA